MNRSRTDTESGGGDLSPLGDVLARVIDERGWREQVEDGAVHTHWTDIAGEQLAVQATPVRLRGGVLIVRARSGPWAAQVRYLSPWLLQRAQEVLGVDQVTEVRIVSGTGSSA